MRCSLNVIPQTKDLLNKSRLPLGILIHPFKDLEVKIFHLKKKPKFYFHIIFLEFKCYSGYKNCSM
jgi:hypothetical protein